MNNKNCFSLRRIFLLMKFYLTLYRSALINFIVTISLFLLLANVFNLNNIIMVNQQPELFLILLFGGGTYISSVAFRNFHKVQKNTFFIMLPVSIPEKIFTIWFLTSVGYALFVLLLYSLFYWLLALFILIFTGANYFISIPFLSSTWSNILCYIALQPVILLGSIYFKKYALAKTFFVLCIFAILLLVIKTISFNGNVFMHLYFTSQLLMILKAIVYCIIAPACLVSGYFRLRELEI